MKISGRRTTRSSRAGSGSCRAREGACNSPFRVQWRRGRNLGIHRRRNGMRGVTHGIALVRRRRASCATLEPLEPRRFLSAVLEAHPSTTAEVNSSALAVSYDPVQIQAVYGLTELAAANPATRID